MQIFGTTSPLDFLYHIAMHANLSKVAAFPSANIQL